MDDLLTPLLPSGLNSTSPLIDELLVDDVDTDSCRLLGPVALAVQGVMGLIVIGGLLIKRTRERPRRKWKIWLADVGKQVVGQFAVHASNVAISDLIATNRSDNPCSLYALNILIDTTLGVLILYFLLHYSTLVVQRFQPEYQTGFYGAPSFSVSLWAEQAAVYVLCLSVMKVVVLVIFWLAPELEDGMSWSLSWTNEEAQVVIVMLILPLVMNLFQFLMVDSIIRLKDPNSPATVDPNSDEEAQRRGFLDDGAASDDDDNDGDETFRGTRSTPRDGRSRRESRRTTDEDGEYEDLDMDILRGGRSIEGEDDDDDDDEYKGTRKKEEKKKRQQQQAEALLFDADSPTIEQLATMPPGGDPTATSRVRSTQAYPPLSAASSRAAQDGRERLPPYSALPPPPPSTVTPGHVARPPFDASNQFELDDAGGQDAVEDDDGWGERWSASSDIEEEEESRKRPPRPHPDLAPNQAAPTSETSRVAAGSSLPRSHPLATTSPHAEPTPLPHFSTAQRTVTPSPSASRFFTPAGSGSTTPLPNPPTLVSADGARSGTGVSDRDGEVGQEEEEEGEEADDDWGFGESVESPGAHDAVPLPSTLSTRTPEPTTRRSSHAEAMLNPSTLPLPSRPGGRTGPGEAETSTEQPDEAAQEEEDDDDDWGFGSASAGASPALPPIPAFKVVPASPSVPPSTAPPPSGSLTTPDSSATVATKADLGSPVEPRDRTNETAAAGSDGESQALESEELMERKGLEARAGETGGTQEDDDDWGFDEALSDDDERHGGNLDDVGDGEVQAVPSPLPGAHSAVEKALGMNEEAMEIEPGVRAPNEIGRELDGLS